MVTQPAQHYYQTTIDSKTTSLPSQRLTVQSQHRLFQLSQIQHQISTYAFTPTAVGTYNLTFNFPGQVYGANGDGYPASTLINDTYLPSSASTTLTVQSTPIPAATLALRLPTDYWTRPIYGENTNWYTISSNWLGTGSPCSAQHWLYYRRIRFTMAMP